MKLLPKARPVQISKLSLGGKDINSKADLLKNFILSEIIILDKKFVLWLKRNEELKDKASIVEKIFNSETTEPVDKAKQLLDVFDTRWKDKELKSILFEDGNNTNFLKGILQLYSPDRELALRLMRKIKGDKSWMKEWLEDCASKFDQPKFHSEYANYLQDINPEAATIHLIKAAKTGNKAGKSNISKEEITEVLKEEFVIYVPFRNNDAKYVAKIIRFKLMKDEEYFYISDRVLDDGIIEAENCRRDDCECGINYIKHHTKFKLDYPTAKQWKFAKDFILSDGRRHQTEWLDKGHADRGTCKTDPYDVVKARFRPVINIKEENIKLLLNEFTCD